MSYKSFWNTILLSFSLLITSCWAQNAELLKLDDIRPMMQEILKQHLKQKEMNESLLQSALKRYIDQFDSDHTYLLQKEASTYESIAPQELTHILHAYQTNDLSLFRKLNETITKSIFREREIRQILYQSPEILFDKASQGNGVSTADVDFPKSEAELKERVANDIVLFIQGQSSRYTAPNSVEDQKRFLAAYEKKSREWENPYLGVNEVGQPLTTPEQENLFAMHVLKALASTLDAHTNALNPREAEDMRLRLEKKLFGIGVQLKKKNHEIVIAGFIENSPAEKSGKLQLEDLLVEINGQSVKGEPLKRVLDLLREPGDPEISLVVQRQPDQLITVKLKREFIPVNEGRVQIAEEPFKEGIIGKITLSSFYQGDKDVSSENDLKNAILQLKKKGNLRGIVLDLRDNTGGFVTQAVKVVSLFITNGVVLISKYSNGAERIYRDTDGEDIWEGPLVVLTSRETASAAEIVAQALQDYGVALIVGDEQTFGKGTIQTQTVTNASGKPSFFKVTVGKYYTVSGRTPQLQGVKADIVVPSPLFEGEIGEEYLDNTLKADQIAPAYEDPLMDITPALRPWYLRYYTPTVQHKVTKWRNMLPYLSKNSESRLAANNRYLSWLQGHPAFSNDDMQMEEAVSIVKDMITAEKPD